MKNTTIGIALVAVILIAIGGYLYPKVSERQERPVGAISGPNIFSEFLNINGVETHYRGQHFSTASTTRCAIQSPRNATSTLSFDGVIKAATSTDYTITIAKSANQFATTTLIRELVNTEDGMIALPTASTTYDLLADTNRTFKPGEWLVVSTAGPTATAFDFGYCSAMFNVGA